MTFSKKTLFFQSFCGELWGIVGRFFYFCTTLALFFKYVHMRFLGNIEAKIDAKGRVFLPASFRKVLQQAGEEDLVLRKDVFQPCLVLFPRSTWDEQMDLVRNRLSRWKKDQQAIYRQFVSDLEEFNLDGNGRFLVPKRYLKMANIRQSVKFIGMGDCIELWSNDSEDEKPFVDLEDFGNALERLMDDTPQSITNESL